MSSPPSRSYGLRIVILTVLLGGVLGVAFNVDAILGPPKDDDDLLRLPAVEDGTNMDMETHFAKVVLEKETLKLLDDASNDLPPLPEEWSPADLQRDEGYIEDDDEAEEYYDELDTLSGVAKDSERKVLARHFGSKKGAGKGKGSSIPLAMNPNAAVIKRKASSTKRPATKATAAKPRKGAETSAAKASGPKEKAEARAPKKAGEAPRKSADAAPEAAKSGPTLDPNATAKELRMQAKRLMITGNPDLAVKAFRLALKKEPGSTRARYGLASALYQKNKANDAMKELKRILSANGSHGRALLMMGSVLQDRGQKGEAKRYYQRYLDTYPNSRRAEEVRRILERM